MLREYQCTQADCRSTQAARMAGLAATALFPSRVAESSGLWAYFRGFSPAIQDEVPDSLNLDQSQPFPGCHVESFIQIKQKQSPWCLWE